jgi:hypothetical protein
MRRLEIFGDFNEENCWKVTILRIQKEGGETVKIYRRQIGGVNFIELFHDRVHILALLLKTLNFRAVFQELITYLLPLNFRDGLFSPVDLHT